MSLRHFLGNVLLLLFTLFFALLLSEVLWRTFVSKGDRMREYDPLLGRINPRSAVWTIRAPEYMTEMRTNSRGFRGPELPSEPPSGELRLLFLGDSFVEGKQVPLEERFAEHAGRLLARALQREVTVRALAVGGAEPARELLFYRILGRNFRPHVVVQVFFLENDLLSRTGAYRLEKYGSGLRVADVWIPPPPPCGMKCWILQRSELAMQCYRFLRSMRVISAPTVRQQLGDGEFFWYTRAGQDVLISEERLAVLTAFAHATQEEVERDGARYLAVLMPGMFSIHERERQVIIDRFRSVVSPEEWVPENLSLVVSRALRSAGIPVLDLRPAFVKAAQRKGLLYYLLDAHLNALGNTVTAEAIAQKLLSLHTPSPFPL